MPHQIDASHHPFLTACVALFILIAFTGLGLKIHPSRTLWKQRWERNLAATNFGMLAALMIGIGWGARGEFLPHLHTHPWNTIFGLAIGFWGLTISLKMMLSFLGVKPGSSETKAAPSGT